MAVLTATLVVFGLSIASIGAHAAALGGLAPSTVLGVDVTGSTSAPTVVGCDNFTGTTGASMAGRTVTVAAPCSSRVWTAHIGTWTIQANAGASTTTTSANTTLNTAITNGSAEVVLSSLNTSGRAGGLVVSHNGTTTYLAAVMIDGSPDRIELRIVVGGSSTVIAMVNPTFATTNTLRFTRSGATISVSLNGTTVQTSTLTPAQVTSLGSGGRSGLFGGNASVRFDDFRVTSP